jgi:hypothetical protein
LELLNEKQSPMITSTITFSGFGFVFILLLPGASSLVPIQCTITAVPPHDHVFSRSYPCSKPSQSRRICRSRSLRTNQ